MGLKRGPELDGIIESASQIAARRSQRPTTAHLLLALLADSSTAGELLRRSDVEERRVASAMKAVGAEPQGLIDRVAERAQLLARTAPGLTAAPDAPHNAGGLHILAALMKTEEAAGRRCLVEVGLDPGLVANAALGCLTGAGHKALTTGARAAGEALRAAAEGQPRPTASPLPAEDRASPPHPPSPLPSPSRVRHRTRHLVELKPRAPEPQAAPEPHRPRGRRNRGPDRRSGGAEALPPAVPFAERPPALFEPRPRPTHSRRSEVEGSPSEALAALPLLGRIGRDLCVAAGRGEIDPLVGRAAEIERIVDSLNRRKGNVPCVVGEPGVGKTAVVEGLAARLAASEVSGLEGRTVVQVNVGDLLAGTGVRGALAEKLASLRAEVATLGGKVVVFLDEFHTLLAAAGGEAGEGAQELRAAMASAEFPCIVATTADGYRRYIEQDPGLERRLTRIDVEEPGIDEAVAIVRGASTQYAEHHGVEYDEAGLEAAVRLTHRYLTERRLPDKALAVLDLAGARARRGGEAVVGRPEVAAVVAELTAVPVERLAATDGERLLGLEGHLAVRIVGHQAPIARIAEALRRNAAGLGGRRPVGSFLLLGPTGVGKTETARALAEALFPGGGGMSRFDMSELSEPHSVARLVGAPPGYVGHEAGGHLTEAVRARPYQVVLLDEVEKAHPRVLMLLLQVLEDGRLTDGRGRLVDFTNTVVIMTSNLGVGEAGRGVIGFGSSRGDGGAAAATADAARRALPPELWNRFDEVLYFAALERGEVEEVARRMLAGTAAQLGEARGLEVLFDDAVVFHLIEQGGYDPALGARPMRRAVQRLVESRLAEAVLRGGLGAGDRVVVGVEAGAVVVRPARAARAEGESRVAV